MINLILLPVTVVFLILFAFLYVNDHINIIRKESYLTQLSLTYFLILLLVLSFGRVFADDNKPRIVGPVEQRLFGSSPTDFPEKGKLYIGDKVVLNKGFEQDIHIPEGGSMLIFSIRKRYNYYDYSTPDKEKGTSYTERQHIVYVSYLVVSPTRIRIDTTAQPGQPFLFDELRRPLEYKRLMTRLEMPENINGSNQGAYAYASSTSTYFKKNYRDENSFIIDEFDRLEPNLRLLAVDMPMPSSNNWAQGNREVWKSSVEGWKSIVDYQYNAMFVAGRDGAELSDVKAEYDKETADIKSGKAQEEARKQSETEKKNKESQKVNADNAGKKDKSDEVNNPWDFLKVVGKLLIYDEDEVKKAINSSMTKIKFMANGNKVNGSTFNPANNASFPIWSNTVTALDNAGTNELNGATALGTGNVDWRLLTKYSVRMIASFAILGYVMKIKERIAAK